MLAQSEQRIERNEGEVELKATWYFEFVYRPSHPVRLTFFLCARSLSS